MQFSLKLVKITAYACPRKHSVFHYKTFSGTPQRYFGNLDSKAEDNVNWEINFYAMNINIIARINSFPSSRFSRLCLRDFRSISLGFPRRGFVVEHVVPSRAGIGSNFDQFQRKLHKLSQLLLRIIANRQIYVLICYCSMA